MSGIWHHACCCTGPNRGGVFLFYMNFRNPGDVHFRCKHYLEASWDTCLDLRVETDRNYDAFYTAIGPQGSAIVAHRWYDEPDQLTGHLSYHWLNQFNQSDESWYSSLVNGSKTIWNDVAYMGYGYQHQALCAGNHAAYVGITDRSDSGDEDCFLRVISGGKNELWEEEFTLNPFTEYGWIFDVTTGSHIYGYTGPEPHFLFEATDGATIYWIHAYRGTDGVWHHEDVTSTAPTYQGQAMALDYGNSAWVDADGAMHIVKYWADTGTSTEGMIDWWYDKNDEGNWQVSWAGYMDGGVYRPVLTGPYLPGSLEINKRGVRTCYVSGLDDLEFMRNWPPYILGWETNAYVHPPMTTHGTNAFGVDRIGRPHVWFYQGGMGVWSYEWWRMAEGEITHGDWEVKDPGLSSDSAKEFPHSFLVR
jgi:hypothetical protein